MTTMTPDSPAKEQTPDRVMILVLGMHRSGTSALSGVLNTLGCTEPKTPMPVGESNPKGYFESDLVYRFNDEVLSKAGSNWQDWQPFNPDWIVSPVGKAFLPQARDLLIEEFGDEPLVVFKDPRICRMVPFWRDAAGMAGFKALPVLIHRNPFEVAKSLYRRNEIDVAESLAIWLRHVLDAEASTRHDARFFASYRGLLENWPALIGRMQEALGLKFPRFDARSSTQIDAFLSPQLQHFTETPERVFENRTLSIWVRDTYEIFERWAATGEAEADYKKLDQIRRGFDDAAPLFSQLAGPDTGLVKDLNARLAAVESEKQAYEAKLAEFAELQNLATDHDAARTDLKIELEKSQSQAAAQKAAHETARQALLAAEEQLSRTNTDLTETKDRLSQTQSALAQRRLEAEETGQRADKLEQAQIQAQAQITRLEADIEKHMHENADLTRRLTQAETEAAQYLGQIEELTGDLVARKQELSESALLVTKHESTIAKVSDENAKLCARQNTQIKELSELARFLKEAETALAQKSQNVISLEQARQSQSAALAAEQAKTAAVTAESAAVTAESAALKVRIQALENEISSFRKSTFWRLTKPLRVIVDTVRGHR